MQKAGGADLAKPPIGKYLWQPHHAMKRDNKTVPPSPPTTTTPSTTSNGPNPSTPTPSQHPFQVPTMTPSQTPMVTQGFMPPFLPMFTPFFNPYNPYATTPSTPTPAPTATGTKSEEPRGVKRPIDLRSSSPIYDLEDNEHMSVEEFCARYRLGNKAVEGLTALQFIPGDKLSVVSEKEYTSVGFTSLSWSRVIRANKEYKSSISNK